MTYKGTGPLTTDLIGGHVKLALNVLAPALSNLKSGGLRALAVLGAEALDAAAGGADLRRGGPAGLRSPG